MMQVEVESTSGWLGISQPGLPGMVISAMWPAWVSKLVPNLGMRGLPLDHLQREMPTIYQVKHQAADQAWQLVALFNWEDHPADLHLRFDELGYRMGAERHVFDYWSGKYMRITEPELVFGNVPPHGCKLLRVCEVGTSPQLVGDTLHISQGGEIASMTQEEGRLVLKTVDMGRQVEGELWLALPGMPKRATCNGEQVEVVAREHGVYGLHISFTGMGKSEINF